MGKLQKNKKTSHTEAPLRSAQAQGRCRVFQSGPTEETIERGLLERAIITVEAPGDQKNLSVLWLKYNFNMITKTSIFAIHFYFLYFFNVNDDHGTFFNGRIRFLVRLNGLYRYPNSVDRMEIRPSFCR